MKANCVLGVFQRMAGQHKNDGVCSSNFALSNQFLQPGKRDRRGRLASQPFGADFCLCDGYFPLVDIKAPSPGVLNDARSLAP